MISIKTDLSSEWRRVHDMVFKSGEVNPTVPTVHLHNAKEISIAAILKTSDDVMSLVMSVDAIRVYNPSASLVLYLPHVPYGRQDRPCNFGEANGIRAFARILNSLKFKEVHIIDPHSEVTPALIDNVIVKPLGTIMGHLRRYMNTKKAVLISPDAGAMKRVSAAGSTIGIDVIMATKVRNLETRELSDTAVHGDVTSKECWIIDDLCDGGRTFIALAKVLKEKGAESVNLYTTHGLYTFGVEHLLEEIDSIWTTDSMGSIHSRMEYMGLVNIVECWYTTREAF